MNTNFIAQVPYDFKDVKVSPAHVLKTTLITVFHGVIAEKTKTVVYNTHVEKEPIIPAEHYLGSQPDIEIRYMTR